MKNALTLVVAVYNAVQYLEFILHALERQTLTGFEVIIADDGSGPEIRELIERTAPRLRFRITHLWQEDRGWRKNVILNKAILAASTDYVVFIDGDCIPHRSFLTDHLDNRKSNAVLCGRRVNLSKRMTDALTLDSIRSGRFERFSWNLLWDGAMARSYNLEDAIRIEHRGIRGLLHGNRARILGCNFSVEKKLLEAINGFDEDYLGPGLGEDSDIAFRLELNGAQLVTLRYLAVLYHCYHQQTAVSDRNKELFERVTTTRRVRCVNGLQKHGSAIDA